ncbi:hypothetical protein Ancab_007532, partial [Ancistrocladus abbreviatus]
MAPGNGITSSIVEDTTANSVTDSQMVNMNRINGANEGGKEAEDIWAILEQLGLAVSEVEEPAMVGQIKEMECRDPRCLKVKELMGKSKEKRDLQIDVNFQKKEFHWLGNDLLEKLAFNLWVALPLEARDALEDYGAEKIEW